MPLLGDAAHFLPPAGDGADLAMLEGTKLSEAIAARPGDIGNELTTYGATMRQKGTAAVQIERLTLDGNPNQRPSQST